MRISEVPLVAFGQEVRRRRLLEALRPRGVGEYVRARLGVGWTASQLASRVERETYAGVVDPVAEAHADLVALVRDGHVLRKQVRWTAQINTKGPRDMLVDVFRLA